MKKNIITMVKTLLFMSVTTGLLILLMSFLFYKTHISDSGINVGVIVTYLLSTFIGGFIYGKIKDRRKFLYGMMIGAIYFCVLAVCSYIISGSIGVVTKDGIMALLCCVGGGMIGGMVS